MTGRTALLDGDPQSALPAFEAIAQTTPDYINCAEGFCVGIWTYIGRTYHELGEDQKALAALRKGQGLHSSDYLNPVYLGLVMAMTGQRQQGKAMLASGLKALQDWLAGYAGRGNGRFWDPGAKIQQSIAAIRALLERDAVPWDLVNDDIHSLALNLEQEVRDVRDQKENRRARF